MTNEELKNESNFISNKEIRAYSRKLCSEAGFDPKTEYGFPVVSNNANHSSLYYTLLGSVYNTFRHAFYLGGTKEELTDIARYIVVLLESIEEPLNFMRCRIEHHIVELDEKYSYGTFVQLELPDIRRRNEEYESSKAGV